MNADVFIRVRSFCVTLTLTLHSFILKLRPLLAVHVFGSEGSGKETLRTQWLESTHAAVLSEVADVCFVVEVCTKERGRVSK